MFSIAYGIWVSSSEGSVIGGIVYLNGHGVLKVSVTFYQLNNFINN